MTLQDNINIEMIQNSMIEIVKEYQVKIKNAIFKEIKD